MPDLNIEPSEKELKDIYPEYYPTNPDLPQKAARLLLNIPTPQEASEKFDREAHKFSYYRDLKFVEGAQKAKEAFELENPRDNFFDNTYFIVDTGTAHSISIGNWLLKNNVDVGIVVSPTQKISTKERTETILALIRDSFKNRSVTPGRLATLIDCHRDDFIIGNSEATDITDDELFPLDKFETNNVKKVVVLAERRIGEYRPQSMGSHSLKGGESTLSKYLKSAESRGIGVKVFGIDQYATEGQNGATDSQRYPQSFNTTSSQAFVNKIS